MIALFFITKMKYANYVYILVIKIMKSYRLPHPIKYALPFNLRQAKIEKKLTLDLRHGYSSSVGKVS